MKSNEQLISELHKKHELYMIYGLNAAQDVVEAGGSAEIVQMQADGIVEKYRGLLEKVRHEYQSDTEQAHERLDTERREDEKIQNEAKLMEAKESKRLAEALRRRILITYDWTHYSWKVGLEFLCVFAETSYNAYSFTVSGGSILLNILPALVVSIAICAVAMHLGAKIRDDGEAASKGLIRKYALGMLIVFISLGMLRSFATIGDGSINFAGSTLIGMASYVVINAVIFVGAVLIAKDFPSKEERLAKKEYDKLSKQIQQADGKISECERKTQCDKEASYTTRKNRIAIIGEQTHLETLITSMCQQCLAAFHQEIALRRPSGRIG